MASQAEKLRENATAMGLRFVTLQPLSCADGRCFRVDLRDPSGGIWMFANHESAMNIWQALIDWQDRK